MAPTTLDPRKLDAIDGIGTASVLCLEEKRPEKAFKWAIHRRVVGWDLILSIAQNRGAAGSLYFKIGFASSTFGSCSYSFRRNPWADDHL